MRKYRFLEKKAEGIAVLMCLDPRVTATQDLWTLGKIRRGRDKNCIVTGKLIQPGTEAWIPLTFGNNRMDRISEEGMRRLMDEAR